MPYRKGVEYWCVLVLATRFGFHTVTVYATPRDNTTESEMQKDLVNYAFRGFRLSGFEEYRIVYMSVTEERH